MRDGVSVKEQLCECVQANRQMELNVCTSVSTYVIWLLLYFTTQFNHSTTKTQNIIANTIEEVSLQSLSNKWIDYIQC